MLSVLPYYICRAIRCFLLYLLHLTGHLHFLRFHIRMPPPSPCAVRHASSRLSALSGCPTLLTPFCCEWNRRLRIVLRFELYCLFLQSSLQTLLASLCHPTVNRTGDIVPRCLISDSISCPQTHAYRVPLAVGISPTTTLVSPTG